MKIKTLITISLSILFSVTLTLGIFTVSTTTALAEQIAQAPTEVVTPETDIKTAKELKKEAKKQQKEAEKEAKKQQKEAKKEAKKQQKEAEKEAEASETITATPS
ncbi:hypothetical protein [Aphanothece hegewaldii]|uniref:hypothetical protein n=1 Tax=Aphanothece hegewaldii TaxID=1521625 RepID=UPI0011B22862|nr:hypothetical protein [Aphanothece hegewaldii]